MTPIVKDIARAKFTDKHFVGTVAFKSEEFTLPDGSKMALGIDGEHWVLIYQPAAGATFQAYKYDQAEKKLIIDEKPGTDKQLAEFKKLIAYFFANADEDELVTLIPLKGSQNDKC